MSRHRRQRGRNSSSFQRGGTSSSRRRRTSRPSHASVAERPKKATTNKKFFVLLVLLGLGLYGGRHFLVCLYKEKPGNYATHCRLSGRKAGQETDTNVSAPVSTIADRVQQKKATLDFQKARQKQEMISEKFKEPLGKISALTPESANLDRGVHFPEDDSMKAVFEDLKQQPYENDLYEDPEHLARKQMEHQKWIDEHLREKNEKEREEFIKKFVQIAQEQGYKVLWTKDMKVLLEPIEPKEPKEEEPEEIKIIYE